MKIGIVIGTNDPEVVWNAFRLGNIALKENPPNEGLFDQQRSRN